LDETTARVVTSERRFLPATDYAAVMSELAKVIPPYISVSFAAVKRRRNIGSAFSHRGIARRRSRSASRRCDSIRACGFIELRVHRGTLAKPSAVARAQTRRALSGTAGRSPRCVHANVPSAFCSAPSSGSLPPGISVDPSRESKTLTSSFARSAAEEVGESLRTTSLLLVSGSEFTLFAMWFDMESNRDLR
jgi:hypothetical protein